MAGLETVPVMLHAGLTDEEVSRKADQDNENDEYHLPVSPVDVWAEYTRLRDEEGWTQGRIAGAKGVDRSFVAKRLKLHIMPDAVKQNVNQGTLTEAHLLEIMAVCVDSQLGLWLSTEQAWEELATQAVRDRGKNGDKSVRAVRQDVDRWKEFIDYARRVYESLPETATIYDLSGDGPVQAKSHPRIDFVTAMAARNARSLVKVKAAEQEIRSAIADNLAAYERFVSSKSAEAARAGDEVAQKAVQALDEGKPTIHKAYRIAPAAREGP